MTRTNSDVRHRTVRTHLTGTQIEIFILENVLEISKRNAEDADGNFDVLLILFENYVLKKTFRARQQPRLVEINETTK